MSRGRAYIAIALALAGLWYGYWVVDEWIARARCERAHGVFHSNPDEHICVDEKAVIK